MDDKDGSEGHDGSNKCEVSAGGGADGDICERRCGSIALRNRSFEWVAGISKTFIKDEAA